MNAREEFLECLRLTYTHAHSAEEAVGRAKILFAAVSEAEDREHCEGSPSGVPSPSADKGPAKPRPQSRQR